MTTDLEHQAVINGRELPALAKSGEYQELEEHRIRCACRRTTIARFYVGADEATGEPAAWIRLPAYVTAGGMKVPAQATTVPLEAGDVGWTQVAQCSHCRATWIAFTGGIPENLGAMPDGGVGSWLVFSTPRASSADPWEAGEEYVTGKLTGEILRGAGPAVLARLDSATWGKVRADADDTPEGGTG